MMKKSLVAVGVIVALGVVWTGGAWYTGKQLETHIADMVSQANTQLKLSAPEAGLEVSYQDYQRGVFSSQLKMVVKPIAGAEKSWLKAGQSVLLDETVSHGPFPLASLKSFNLVPAMAAVNTRLVNNDVTKQLFEIAKGESPFDINTRISYNGDTKSDISLKPLDYEKDTDKVSFSGGEFTVSADNQGSLVALTGEAKSGQINAVNEYDQKVQVTFNNLKTDGTSSLASFGERIGDQTIDLERLAIAVEGKDLAELKGMRIAGKSDLSADKKKINSQLEYSLNNLKLQNQDFGSGQLMFKVDGIDGAAMHQFSQQYQAQTQALLADPGLAQDPEQYQQKAVEALFSSLPILMKGDPVVTLSPLSWKNAKGESAFNLSLALKDPAQATGEAQTLTQQVDRSVKSLDAKLTIPMDMATELMTQVARLEGYQQEDAAKLAKQQVQGLAAMGQMFRLTTTADNAISSSLQYANGQVTLNGQKMSLEDLVGMFGMPGLTEPAVPAPLPAP
jgi:uncharacterized protein YdgA (DUF945 family)